VRGASAGSAWEFASRAPRAALRPYVRALVGYDERSPHRRVRRQFPTPHVVVIAEFGPPLRVAFRGDCGDRHPGGFAAGIADAYATVAHEGRQRGIQIDLHPTGARRLFGMPLSLLAGRAVSLCDLLPAEHRSLAERIEAATGWSARLDLVEDVIARRILDSRVDTARVDWAIARIAACGGALEVGSLARGLAVSHKHLIALFRDQVGVPPKLLARLVRFERLVERARGPAPIAWAELAADVGYCDQAHLARDVRRFTGLSPTEARLAHAELAPLLA
jgi:AraC-like DNA-binding protein